MTLPRTEIERILALAEKATPSAYRWNINDTEHWTAWETYNAKAIAGLQKHRIPVQFAYADFDPATVKQLCAAALRNTAQAQVTEAADTDGRWYVCVSCRKAIRLPLDTPNLALCQCTPGSYMLMPLRLPKGAQIVRDGETLSAPLPAALEAAARARGTGEERG